ncbi:MAG TPA: cytochrome c biogenesis protein CcsA [Bryobacteraceae bacterium]|nr:cytochrome c biogenesis protein CcsA [Bryobacteraceae bacterium]
MGIFWLRVATALYAVGLIHAIIMVLRRNSVVFRVALGAFCVGIILHMVATVELATSMGRLPLDNFYETSSMCALIIGVLFLLVYWRYQFASLSVFIFPLVFLMTEVGATEIPVHTWPNANIRDAWLLMHILMILLGYAALLLTALASVFYLIQERRLKNKRPGKILERLPPLGTLDNIISNAMGFGFVFITLGTIAGSTWAFIESGTRWIGEPAVAISLATWLFYLVMVFLRASAGWRGRKAAVMALSVLGFAVITWAAHVGLRPLLAR